LEVDEEGTETGAREGVLVGNLEGDAVLVEVAREGETVGFLEGLLVVVVVASDSTL
jgi:hypothetical protein